MSFYIYLNNYYQELSIFLYLIPIISSLWAAYALLINKKRLYSQIYLAICFIILGIGMTLSFYDDRYASGHDNHILRTINLTFSVFSTISILLYFTSLLQPDKLTKKHIIKYVSVGLVYMIILLTYEILFGQSTEKITGWDREFIDISNPSILFRLIAAGCIIPIEIFVFTKILVMYFKYRKYIRESFSYGEDIKLNWILYILFLCMLFGLIDVVWMINTSLFTKAIFNVVSIVVICSIFWLGFRQEEIPIEEDGIIEDLIGSNPFSTKIKPIGLIAEQQEKIESQILDYFNTAKPYLNPELSLNHVANAIKTDKGYIFQLIKRNFNTNFYAFVNKYRVEHAINLIMQNDNDDNINIAAISKQSGFKSKRAFNKQFKEITGYSPCEYIKEVKEKVLNILK